MNIQNSKGFTLIELMVVITIVVVIAGIIGTVIFMSVGASFASIGAWGLVILVLALIFLFLSRTLALVLLVALLGFAFFTDRGADFRACMDNPNAEFSKCINSDIQPAPTETVQPEQSVN